MTTKNIPLDMSAKLLYQAAIKRGIKCTIFDNHQTILMQKDNKFWYTTGSRTSLQSSVGRTIANNKQITKKVFKEFNIPTAKFVIFNEKKSIELLKSLEFPVVVKPTIGAHGRGVVVGVKKPEEVLSIFKKDKKPLIVEEILQGIEYRVLCINYKFVAAAFRKNAFVIGDGDNTIEELIKEKNKHPWRGTGHAAKLTSINIDSDLKNYLSEQNLTLNYVPNKDQQVVLRKTSNLSTGGEAWDVSELVSQENKDLFEKIAKVCDLNNVGIDVMCQNLGKPITTQTAAGIIEVNGSPGLRMHHYPMKGKVVDAAGKILDMIEENIDHLHELN